MKKLYLIFALTFLFANNNDFLKILNEVNEIAFKAKLNIDKTPSNVTVLKRDFIINSGAKTLFELLNYVPGIQTSISSSGKKEIIIRGNKSTYRDKIKFLINGVSVTNNLYTNQFYYYNFPTSLIKRVEITLTPDSVMYGDNAFLGVINIVTLDNLNDNQFYFYQSNKKETSVSVFQKFNNLTIDSYYQVFDPDLSRQKVLLGNLITKEQKFYREAIPNRFEKNIGLGIKYKRDSSILMYRLNYYKKGNFFGIVNMIPLRDDKSVKMLHQYLDYNFFVFLNEHWKNDIHIGIKNYSWKGEFRAFPYDFNETIDNNPENDLILGASIKEYEVYFNESLKFISENHIANYILNLKYSKPYDVYYLQYIPNFNNKKRLKGEENILRENIYRRVTEIGVEDLYFLNEKLSFVYGGRYSTYSDFGNNFSYKLGGIYNKDKFNTFKLLFNTAFRAPSWIELYANTAASFNGNPNLQPEKIKMGEFIYLHNFTKNIKMKFSYYLGKEKNFIGRVFSNKEGRKVYKNLGDFLIKGFEISYYTIFDKIYFNLSYSFNENKALFTNKIEDIDFYKYLGIRKYLTKGYFGYKFNNLNIAISGIYGSKIRTPKYIKDVNHYFTLNTNLVYNRDTISLQLGINNLTNHKNYALAIPNDFIYNNYIFVQPDSRMEYRDRNIYFNLIKRW